MNTSACSKRPFYKYAYLYFILAFIIVNIGFFRSYLSKVGQSDIIHHIHGMLAAGWMILLIVEPILYSTGRLKFHRNLGKVTFVLVPLIVFSAALMIRVMIRVKDSYPPLSVYQLSFVDIFSMLQFILFYILAIVKCRQLQLHARYMAATVFLFVIPGLGRMLFMFPGVTSFNIALNVCFVLVEISLLLLILDDKRSGQFRLPYILALALFAVQHVCLNYVTGWAWWQALMNGYAGLSVS